MGNNAERAALFFHDARKLRKEAEELRKSNPNSSQAIEKERLADQYATMTENILLGKL